MPGKKKNPPKGHVSIIAEEGNLSLGSGQLWLSINALAKAGSRKATRGGAGWGKRVSLPPLPSLWGAGGKRPDQLKNVSR